MASYNGGLTHESGKAVVRNTGHCIQVSRVETDTKELCWPLANYGKGLLPAIPSTPYDGPPLTGLARWWNASTPLLSAEGDEVVYTKTGTPTVGTAHGLDAIKFTLGTQNYTGASPITNNTGVDYCLYILLSRTASFTTGPQGNGNATGGMGDNGSLVYVTPSIRGSINSHLTAAESDDENVTNGPASILNQAQVLVLDYDSTGRLMRAGLDGTFSSFTASPNPVYTFINHAIGSSQPGEFPTIIDTWIMDALIYSGARYNQDVTDWLLARTS